MSENAINSVYLSVRLRQARWSNGLATKPALAGCDKERSVLVRM